VIREANKFDVPEIVRMLKSYRDNAPAKFLQSASNQPYIERFLRTIIAVDGFILLAIKDEKPIGMLIAIKHPNVWDAEIKQISEIAFWVDEDKRGGSAGSRLLKTYIKKCDEYKSKKQIAFFTISKMHNMTDVNYARFGFQKLEETWTK